LSRDRFGDDEYASSDSLYSLSLSFLQIRIVVGHKQVTPYFKVRRIQNKIDLPSVAKAHRGEKGRPISRFVGVAPTTTKLRNSL
jgi:hypothetical protein